MAEFVQQNIEDMLPELEQMERVGLFTSAETRAILKKRKAHEYRLKRRTKHKEDILQYAHYEINLLALVKKRRQKIGYNFKLTEIDIPIVQRIHKLFKFACFRFQDDVKLWLSHIEFCKSRGEKATIGKIYTRMLQVHNRKPHLWILAAKWEIEDNVAIENARSLLQRGLRFNPTSKKLWIEYFRMELLNADKLRKRQEILGIANMDVDEEGISVALLEGRVALVVYKKATETFPDDVEFTLSFLPVCQLFDFTHTVEEQIFTDLQERHPSSELTLDAVARRPLKRAALTDICKIDKQERESAILQSEEECCAIYEQAVEQIPTEKMWTLYLENCLQRIELKAPRKLTDQRVFRFRSVADRALQKEKLSEDMFLKLISVLLKTGEVEQAGVISVAATRCHRQSCTVWKMRVDVAMTLEADRETVWSVVEEAIKAVPAQDSLWLWRQAAEWAVVNRPQEIETFLELGLTQCGCVCEFVKELYLDWALVEGGIHRVRQVYKRCVISKPHSLQFFYKYIHMEEAQASVKMKKVRQAYEDVVSEFGKTETDVWLAYIKMELQHPKGQPENAGYIHWRAQKALDGELVERFINQYTLLQNGHM